MTALGTKASGIREIIGFNVYPRESKETWKDFLMSLRKRGLGGILKVTSDAHEGIRYGLDQVYPNVPWQRCHFHFSRNISDKDPRKYQTDIRTELQEMFNCKTVDEARWKKTKSYSPTKTLPLKRYLI